MTRTFRFQDHFFWEMELKLINITDCFSVLYIYIYIYIYIYGIIIVTDCFCTSLFHSQADPLHFTSFQHMLRCFSVSIIHQALTQTTGSLNSWIWIHDLSTRVYTQAGNPGLQSQTKDFLVESTQNLAGENLWQAHHLARNSHPSTLNYQETNWQTGEKEKK